MPMIMSVTAVGTHHAGLAACFFGAADGVMLGFLRRFDSGTVAPSHVVVVPCGTSLVWARWRHPAPRSPHSVTPARLRRGAAGEEEPWRDPMRPARSRPRPPRTAVPDAPSGCWPW